MATREQKIKFAVKRFKGFWNVYKRSKRGMLGLAIIIFFSIIAVFAPFIAPNPPLEPKFGVGEYHAYGPTDGPKLASPLSKPIWYKYLPGISRGEVTNYKSAYTFSFMGYQFFIPEEKYNETVRQLPPETKLQISSDDRIHLPERTFNIKKIEALLPNNTIIELEENRDWQHTQTLSDVYFKILFPDDTKIKVEYTVGSDLVENIKVVKDHKFVKPESLKEWNYTYKPTFPGIIKVNHNSEKGFKFNEANDGGCIEINYIHQSTSPPSVEVTFYHPFTYPYYEPPKRFLIHLTSNATGISNYYITVSFYSENEAKEFITYTKSFATTGAYQYLLVDSSDPTVARNIGVTSHPEERIFTKPGNFTLGVRIRFVPENANATIYLDQIDCLLYGNIYGIMGTDNDTHPKDIFSTFLYGSRISLIVGLLTALFSTLIGLVLGLVSGYIYGIVDEAIMRFADLLLVLPTLPLFIVLISALRAVSGYVSMWNIIFILTFFGWMSFARSVRSMVLSLKERAFIEAARAAGGGKPYIIFRHILPNVFALVYITLATSVPGAIITEASLSWLGLGDPRLPSWGKILYDFSNSGVVTTKGLTEYWFWVFPTCLAIAILAGAFILVGYALDEILNPKLRERQ